MEAKMAELSETKEELERAKDDAMQSWLDSRPLIDELEKLQSDLERAKKQSAMSNVVISDLESQLETINISSRLKKEEEMKGRTMINEFNQDLEKTRQEMEQIKLETDEERQARIKLKQVLRLQRQTLRTLQLKLRAIRLESEAFGTSAAEAMLYINHSETENNTVQLNLTDYYSLTRRAKEETSLASWRVSMAMEQKLAAQENRDSAVRKLEEVCSRNQSRKNKIKDIINGNENIEIKVEEDSTTRGGAQATNNEQIAFTKARARSTAEAGQRNPQQLRRSKISKNKTFVKRKKKSICARIKTSIVRKITRLFG